MASQLMAQEDNNVQMSMILDKWGIKSDSIVARQNIDTNKQAENTEIFGNNIGSLTKTVGDYKVYTDAMGSTVSIWQGETQLFGGSVEDFAVAAKELPEDIRNLLTETVNNLISQVENESESEEKDKSKNQGVNLGGGKYYKDDDGDGWNDNGPTGIGVDIRPALKAIKETSSNSTAPAWITNSQATYNKNFVEEAASGTLNATEKPYNIDEIGKELVIPSGRLRMMEYGDQVVPHNLSENILKWGALNPAILRSLSPEHTNNITNNKEVKVNIENVNLDNVTNGENFMPELNRYLQRTNTLL